MLASLFSFTHGVDTVYPGVQGAKYWTEDPFMNGPMVGPGRDEMINPGIPIDSYASQPAQYNYGVPMVGAFSPVNTYVYEPKWAPNAI
eukprot:CAMPEP_0174916564 /NCGR_PEP_ID=MMETSP1355-20121228/1884_1 /TAXON_ID=464990 /ORGANISM="Hemiselmis tepida, Strain CCMP443" /LENGTH=87 /DNA_ID=CAMNT_0016161573 /DNA_START=1 /DNA_END=264 /DNA_ORIENTATION=+